ncbi:MAG TPA: hypothetical protein VIC28_18635 [Thermoanaerobaculia bacterium]
MSEHGSKRRFGKSDDDDFDPVLKDMPPLPVIDWSLIGQKAPELLDTPYDYLPAADAVVITWVESEWAALEHVFCNSGSSMPYSDSVEDYWSGWQKYDQDLPEGHPSDWTFWGYYRLVSIQGRKVLLFKSNTHLDEEGESYLEEMIEKIIDYVKPSLILSIGTAGGAMTQDHVGTVRAVSAGTLYEESEPPSQWPDYSSSWSAVWKVLEQQGFSQLLFPVPTTQSDLQSLCDQFNHYYGTSYSLSELNAGGLDMGDSEPKIYNMTGGGESLLTTSTFLVGTTSGSYQNFAVIEMDDAIVGKVCKSYATPFGFVRNVSDPVQNQDLPSSVQGNWGGAIYDVYGFYTSYNGALAAWAVLIGQFGGGS